MLDFLNRVFGREEKSKNVAKERLRLVLVHDRANVSPEVIEALKNDLIKVITNYMDIDEKALDVALTKEDDSVALVANIPILRMKKRIVDNAG